MNKQPMILVVGRAGAGKSEVARAMSQVLGWPVVERFCFRDSGYVLHGCFSRKQINLLKECEDVWAVLHVVRDVATTQLGRLPDGETWLPNNRSREHLRDLARYRAAQIIENRRDESKEET